MQKNNFYRNKTILVTGGAGSIGSEIVKEVIGREPKVIRVLDNNETGLFNLEQELQSGKIRLFVGDVRDRKRLRRAMEGVDIVFHAAALKHVPLCEYNPFEAIQTNVIGTQNIIDACLDTQVQKMINISTDKAVNPINVMGATKLLTEKLVVAANYYKGKRKTIFSSVRFGNVLNSRGSIVPLFHQQIKKGGPVTITDAKMTRFAMSIPKAVELVLKAAEIAEGEEIFIFKMPVLRIEDLAKVMIEELAPKYNHKPDLIKIKIIGKKMGEKLAEELIAKDDLKNAYETEDMLVILPNGRKVSKCQPFKKISSLRNFRIFSKKEIKKLFGEVLFSPLKSF